MSDTSHPQTYDMVLGLRVHRRFLEDPIPTGEVEAILEAARWTGSSKNTQKWAFVVIDEPADLERLATAGSFTRPIQAAALAVAMVWPSDGYEFDIGRVAQNMMLAASSMGIGSCPVTLHDEDRAREVLVPWPGTLAMLRARQGRLWQGLRTKAHFTCVEDEDTARGVPGRRQRAKRLWSGY
jgi:nitroreductase